MALYGIYGNHTVEACPLNHKENGVKLIAFSEIEPKDLLEKYRIHQVLGQYHSAFEHTFVWIVDADNPHLIEELALETGLASFNRLKIIPMKDLAESVVPRIKAMHGL